MPSDGNATDPALIILDSPERAPGRIDQTIERSPNLKPLWIFGLAVIGVAIAAGVSSILDKSGDDPDAAAEESANAQPLSEDAASGTIETVPTPIEPGRRSLGQFGAGPGPPLPERIAPLPIGPEHLLVGHSIGFRVGAVGADGEVQEFLAGDGARFLPLTHIETALLGVSTLTGSTVVVGSDGSVHTVSTDSTDAPLFYPRADGDGFIMYGTQKGELTVLDSNGVALSTGRLLALGTRVIADSAHGLVVEGVDGQARIVDLTTGEVIAQLPSVPLAVGGSRQVAVTCTSALACRLSISPLLPGPDGGAGFTLDGDPTMASRLVVGFSGNHGLMVYRQSGGMEIIDAHTGEVMGRIDGFASATTAWLADELLVAWTSDRQTAVWRPGTEAVLIDLGEAVIPVLRGLTPLRIR